MKAKPILCLALVLSGVGLWLLLSPAKYQAATCIRFGVGDDIPQVEFEIIQSELVLGKVNVNVEWAKTYHDGTLPNMDDKIRWLRKRMALKLDGNRELIQISFTSENPIESARIANAIANAYRDHYLTLQNMRTTLGVQTLMDKYQAEEQEIKTRQGNLEQLRKQLDLPNPVPVEELLKTNYPSYFQAKQELQKKIEFHKLLGAKIESLKVDLQIPNTSMVEIVAPAVPPTAPIGSNRLLGAILLFCGLTGFALGFYLILSGGASGNSKP